MKINSISDVKKTLNETQIKVFGIGGTPITRTEAHHFIDNLEVICSVNAKEEIAQISKKVQITCFPLKNENDTYIKKPSKILSNKKIQDYINTSKKDYDKIAIFVMKPDLSLEKICKENDWILIGNKANIVEKYNHKGVFQEILFKTGLSNDAQILKLNELNDKIDDLFEKLGQKIVIQLAVSGGGRGTFFFEKKDKDTIMKAIKKRIETISDDVSADSDVIVNSFFAGPTLSILGTITRDNGVLVANPQHQLIDIAEVTRLKNDANGVFCGHDWTLFVPDDIRKQAIEIAQKIGIFLQKDKVLGIFGTDLIWDIERNIVVPIEINTRLTGVFPAFVDVQLLHGEVSLMAFHVLDFLNVSYEVDEISVYRKDGFKLGAHLIVFNDNEYDSRLIQSHLRGGVYCLKNNGEIEFKRGGFEISDIKNDREFVVTDGVPEPGAVYMRNRKLLKILSKEPLAENSYTLSEFGKQIVQNIYNSLIFEKYE